MTLWPTVHHERAALADDVASLTRAQWTHPSLCGSWTVEEVLAHLTAAVSIGRLRWLKASWVPGSTSTSTTSGAWSRIEGRTTTRLSNGPVASTPEARLPLVIPQPGWAM